MSRINSFHSSTGFGPSTLAQGGGYAEDDEAKPLLPIGRGRRLAVCSLCAEFVDPHALLCPACGDIVSPIDPDCPFGVLDDRPLLDAVLRGLALAAVVLLLVWTIA